MRISRDGNVYSGPELQLHVQRFEGFFLEPDLPLRRAPARAARAQRIDFLDEQRAVATGATYTSCPRDGSGDPAWLLSTDRVKMDFEANEGIAERRGAALLRRADPGRAGAELSAHRRAQVGLAAADASTSTARAACRSSVPYYWNIAPNRDATLTPLVIGQARRRRWSTEFRYLEPRYEGTLDLHLLPNDRLTGRSRYALNLAHEGALPLGDERCSCACCASPTTTTGRTSRARCPSLTPRLLAADLQAQPAVRRLDQPTRACSAGRCCRTTRQPHRGALRARAADRRCAGLQRAGAAASRSALETEFNRFADPSDGATDPPPRARPACALHALGASRWPFVDAGLDADAQLSFNAAAYSLDEPLADGGADARA